MLRSKRVLGFLFVSFLVSCFAVSWFQSVLASWFQSCLVSKFLGLKVSNIYRISMSCFLEDVDAIPKSLKNLLIGSLGFIGARLFDQS